MTIANAASRSKTATANAIESTEAASAALDMMTRDLRSAGYHADIYWLAAPQPPIAYIDSLQVLMNADFVSTYPNYPNPLFAAADTIPWWPQAYNPAGNPPFPSPGPPDPRSSTPRGRDRPLDAGRDQRRRGERRRHGRSEWHRRSTHRQPERLHLGAPGVRRLGRQRGWQQRRRAPARGTRAEAGRQRAADVPGVSGGPEHAVD